MNAPLSTDRLGSATELDRLFALQREACAREPHGQVVAGTVGANVLLALCVADDLSLIHI